MAKINQEFHSAPLGRRNVIMLFIVLVLVITGASVGFYVSLTKMPAGVPPSTLLVASLAPFLGLVVLVLVFIFQRSLIARFRIEEDCLVLGKKRYPLGGLVGVDRDPLILRWAVRLGGNGGLGAIRGRYWSKRVGKFYVFMTDAEKAVVLRWPDKTVVVSPMDPDFFIYSVRSASGLK
jgi:hypothetical protein